MHIPFPLDSGRNPLEARMTSPLPSAAGRHVGNVRVRPDKVEAGRLETFRISFAAGEKGLAAPGYLAIDFPGLLHTSRPQTYFNEAPGYTTFDFRGLMNYSVFFYSYQDRKIKTLSKEDSIRAAREYRLMIIRLENGSIGPGEEFNVVFGDNSCGMGPGAMMGIVVPYPGYRYLFHYRLFSDSRLKRIIDGGCFGVTVEPSAVANCLCVRGRGKTGKITSVRLQDRFRNAVPQDPAEFLAGGGTGKSASNRYGITVIPGHKKLTPRRRGTPVVNAPSTESAFGESNIYFGDLHVHTEFSIDVKQRQGKTLPPSEMLDCARHSELLDFCALADHHQPWDRVENRLSPREWEITRAAVDQACSDGSFIAFQGMEFRGVRGDTVVIFKDSASFQAVRTVRENSVDALWKKFRENTILTIPHFHNPGDLADGQWFCDDKFDRLVEVHSCHGNFFEFNPEHRPPPGVKEVRADRNALFLLRSGYKYGIMAGSDDHKGHCGRPALCAVFSENLSKKSIFEGLYGRAVYGTSGERIKLVFSANGKLMGSRLAVRAGDDIVLTIEVEGTDRIRAVDLLKNGEVVKRFGGGKFRFSSKTGDSAGRTSVFYQVNVLQENRHMAWSSPIWIMPAKAGGI